MESSSLNMNETSSNVTESCSSSTGSSSEFFIFAYLLVFLTSLAFNSITVRVYFCSSQLRVTSITVFLKNLAAADFFLCLSLLLRIVKYASASRHVPLIYCNFGSQFFYLNMNTSILFITYIAANRYLKITSPLKKHPLNRVHIARYVSIATWTLCLGLFCFYLGLYSSWEPEKSSHLRCDFFINTTISTIYKAYQMICVIVFWIILLSLVLLYRNIVKSLQRPYRESPQISKSKRNMQMLVVVFCVCFVPYHLVILPDTLLKPTLPQCPWERVFDILKELTVLLCSLNACLDPLIYFIFSKAFRAQLRFKRKCHLPGFQSDAANEA